MSTLVEIAEKADVAVEGVVRVLTRRPVSAVVNERVLAVLDHLDAEQAQVVERFALASIVEVLPLGDISANGVPEGPRPSASSGAPQLEARLEDSAGALARSQSDPLRSTDDAELVAQLGVLLRELVDSLAELKDQGAALRQERSADLAVLVDLISSSWQGMERRLGRLEQMVARMEAARR